MIYINEYLEVIRSYIWGPPLLGFIFFAGLYLTFILRGLQFRYLAHSLRLAFFEKSSKKSEGDISNFQALMTSLAAAIGTGNIAGVATAISLGGLGSLVWMWVIAGLGMAIKYSESLLAVKYRVKNEEGEMSGGPMYFASYGTGKWWLGASFASLGIFATLGTGNMVQINSVADAMHATFSVNPWVTGIIAAVITAIVLFGGVKSIARVAEIFVPIMALFYLASGIYIIIINIEFLPAAFSRILNSAFSGQSAVGGFAGSTVALTIQAGIARGIFSNEAGLGTSSIASAAARCHHPSEQGLISMTSAFLSTIIVCTITGLVIALTGVQGQMDAGGKLLNGAALAIQAFQSQLEMGSYIVTFGLIFFAYSTILGWAYYGEKCVEFLFGTQKKILYRCAYVICIILGAGMELQTVWTIADITNGLMALPNLFGILLCRKTIVDQTKSYCAIIKP